jgi:hypothetical protein
MLEANAGVTLCVTMCVPMCVTVHDHVRAHVRYRVRDHVRAHVRDHMCHHVRDYKRHLVRFGCADPHRVPYFAPWSRPSVIADAWQGIFPLAMEVATSIVLLPVQAPLVPLDGGREWIG